jgi:hypothetical protein
MKKLQLKKEVVERLDNDTARNVKGGLITEASCVTCETVCQGNECKNRTMTVAPMLCCEDDKYTQPSLKPACNTVNTVCCAV